MFQRAGLVALALALALGCGQELDNRPLRVGPGGLGGAVADSAVPTPDAAWGDGGTIAIAGRVCVAGLQPLLRAVPGTACPQTGVAGGSIRIEESQASAAVGASGEFTLDAPAGAASVLLRFGPGAGPLQQALLRVKLPPPAQVTLWTANRADLAQLLATIPLTWDEGSTGVVFAYAIDAMRQNVSGVAAPPGFYVDNVSRLDTGLATGPVGLAALADAPPALVSFDLVPPNDVRRLLRTHVDADVRAGFLTIRVVPLNHL